jgi:hypothetical protein
MQSLPSNDISIIFLGPWLFPKKASHYKKKKKAHPTLSLLPLASILAVPSAWNTICLL